MAPHLMGAHFELGCPRCGWRFAMDATIAEQSEFARCPNCGQPEIRLDEESLQSAEQVSVVPLSPDDAEPNRWSFVAFHHPVDTDASAVKRLIGFPDEAIELRSGDLFLDGVRYRKSLEEQLALALPVFSDLDTLYPAEKPVASSQVDSSDNQFIGNDQWTPPSRWIDPTGTWSRQDQAWRTGRSNELDSGDRLTSLSDWLPPLIYVHYSGSSTGQGPWSETPISNRLAYNPVQRLKFEVGDLLLRTRVRATSESRQRIAIQNLHVWMVVEIDWQRSKIVASMSTPSTGSSEPPADSSLALVELDTLELITEAQIPIGADPEEFELCVSTFDHQLLVAIDGQVAVREVWEADESNQAEQPTSRPILMTTDSPDVGFADLEVLRDSYLFWLSRDFTKWSNQTNQPGYFVVGDNQAVSLDSRHWPRGSIQRANLLGVIKAR